MSVSPSWLYGALLVAALGCGHQSAGARDAGKEPSDASAERDADQPDEPATWNGCAAADYEDRSQAADLRVIEIAAMGLRYRPKCMIVARGQRVHFQGSLSAHPLAPGNPEDPEAGSPGSPIEAISTGMEVEYSFDRSGTFPYYCTIHSFGAGQGMAGAIHVR